jgi:hypothetical protein
LLGVAQLASDQVDDTAHEVERHVAKVQVGRLARAADAKAPRQLLDEASRALGAAVKLRVEAAKEKFAALKKPERESLAVEAELREPRHQTDLFKGSYDQIWIEACPACKCRAFMAGEQTGEDISEEFQG